MSHDAFFMVRIDYILEEIEGLKKRINELNTMIVTPQFIYTQLQPFELWKEGCERLINDLSSRIFKLEEYKIKHKIEHKGLEDRVESLLDDEEYEEGNLWCCEHEEELCKRNLIMNNYIAENLRLKQEIKEFILNCGQK